MFKDIPAFALSDLRRRVGKPLFYSDLAQGSSQTSRPYLLAPCTGESRPQHELKTSFVSLSAGAFPHRGGVGPSQLSSLRCICSFCCQSDQRDLLENHGKLQFLE